MADEDTVVAAETPVAQTEELPKEQPSTAEAPKEETAEPELPLATEEKPVEAKQEEEQEEEQEDWKSKELRRKHSQIKERDRELERIRKENDDLRALAESRAKPAVEGTTEQPVLQRATPAQNMSQAQIQEAARQLRDQEKYQESIVTTNTAGEKAYGKEWGAALSNLATLTDEVDINVMRGIMATDAPEKVLYELGKNPAQYQRIMELAPERRQTEFVKLSLKTEAKPKISAAPEPVETVRGRVTPSAMPQDSDDDDTWYAKWEAAQAAKRKKSA